MILPEILLIVDNPHFNVFLQVTVHIAYGMWFRGFMSH